MKIRLLNDLTVPCTDGVLRECRAGDIVSTYHLTGRRLLYRRLAVWIAAESCDPAWNPPEFMKAVKPQHDKMMRGALNKGAA